MTEEDVLNARAKLAERLKVADGSLFQFPTIAVGVEDLRTVLRVLDALDGVEEEEVVGFASWEEMKMSGFPSPTETDR